MELEPFRAAAAAGAAAMMTAHVLYPALDGEQPATLSPRIVGGMLRDELGFDGLVMTDDLEMGAIAGRHAVEDAAVGAIAAGCDMVLVCGTDTDRLAAAVEALIRAVEDERLPRARVEDALARQERVKARFLAGTGGLASAAAGRAARCARMRRAPRRRARDGGAPLMAGLRLPPALRPGDRLALLAPASPIDKDAFDRGVAELRSLGFEPVFDERALAATGYLAGSAAQRAAAFRQAWDDPDIAGIVAVRGGYGSAQILPLLDAAALRRTAKPLLGCSDLTALLAYLTTGCGVVGFHGPMLVEPGAGRGRATTGRRCWGAFAAAEPLGALRPPGVEAIRRGTARGMLLGGTLTLLAASLGTPFAFAPPEGHVLFLDDVGERPYRIDRLLTQIGQAGLLRKAAAVVLAEFPGCGDATGRDARSVCADLLADFPGPVLFGFPSGHTSGPALTLPLGVTVTVAAERQPRPGRRGGRRSHEAGPFHRHLRHRHGHRGGDAQAARLRRRRIGRARLSADERCPGGGPASRRWRAIGRSTSRRTSTWWSSGTPCRAATPRWRPCWIAACATARCRSSCATRSCAAACRSWSPGRTARPPPRS